MITVSEDLLVFSGKSYNFKFDGMVIFQLN